MSLVAPTKAAKFRKCGVQLQASFPNKPSCPHSEYPLTAKKLPHSSLLWNRGLKTMSSQIGTPLTLHTNFHLQLKFPSRRLRGRHCTGLARLSAPPPQGPYHRGTHSPPRQFGGGCLGTRASRPTPPPRWECARSVPRVPSTSPASPGQAAPPPSAA